MADAPYSEAAAVASALLAAAAGTLSFYPRPSVAWEFVASGLAAAYVASTGSRGGSAAAPLAALIASTALSPLWPSLILIVQLASAAALIAVSRGENGSVASLAALASLAYLHPLLLLLAAAASLVAGTWRRPHSLLLPAGYALSAAVGYLGYAGPSASLALASAGALALYLGRGFTSCPFRADRPMASAGLIALTALVPLSGVLPLGSLAAAEAAALYLLVAGILAPASKSSERGLSGDPGPSAA